MMATLHYFTRGFTRGNYQEFQPIKVIELSKVYELCVAEWCLIKEYSDVGCTIDDADDVYNAVYDS